MQSVALDSILLALLTNEMGTPSLALLPLIKL